MIECQSIDISYPFINNVIYDFTFVPHPFLLPFLHEPELEHEQFVKFYRPPSLFYVSGAFRKMDQPQGLPYRQQTVLRLDGFREVAVERKGIEDFSNNLIESLRMNHFTHGICHPETAARFEYQSLSIDFKFVLEVFSRQFDLFAHGKFIFQIGLIEKCHLYIDAVDFHENRQAVFPAPEVFDSRYRPDSRHDSDLLIVLCIS